MLQSLPGADASAVLAACDGLHARIVTLEEHAEKAQKAPKDDVEKDIAELGLDDVDEDFDSDARQERANSFIPEMESKEAHRSNKNMMGTIFVRSFGVRSRLVAPETFRGPRLVSSRLVRACVRPLVRPSVCPSVCVCP